MSTEGRLTVVKNGAAVRGDWWSPLWEERRWRFLRKRPCGMVQQWHGFEAVGFGGVSEVVDALGKIGAGAATLLNLDEVPAGAAASALRWSGGCLGTPVVRVDWVSVRSEVRRGRRVVFVEVVGARVVKSPPRHPCA